MFGLELKDRFETELEQTSPAEKEVSAGLPTCLICLESIGHSDGIWQCWKSCYCIFHLVCIQAWARRQLQARALRSNDDTILQGPGAETTVTVSQWGCPKCRQVFAAEEMPSAYTCFCGKETNPKIDPWLGAHCCGSCCERELGCGHRCNQPCHPQRCPPCPRAITSRCHCGRAEQQKRCSQAVPWSCEMVCGRSLLCGHSCAQVCHTGKCPPCGLIGKYMCRCGCEMASLPCSQASDFLCARACGTALDCGVHLCTTLCCNDPLHQCELNTKARSCPCGKTSQHVSCTEQVPSCGQTCGKLLACGHSCEEKCGQCPATCRVLVEKTCPCGSQARHVQCSETFRCERRCSRVKACGKHACKRRCCDRCPPCEQQCSAKLRCGNHKCPAPCHAGPCGLCPLKSRVKCACGFTSYQLPCGSERHATAPICDRPCLVPTTCRHAGLQLPHRCHFGPCPPCTLPCGTQLLCGHICKSQCHDAEPPAVLEFCTPMPQKSDAFAEVRSYPAARCQDNPAREAAARARSMVATAQRPCNPCMVIVRVPCHRGHSMLEQLCSAVSPFSCGQPCGAILGCGNHVCIKPCHAKASPKSPDEEGCGRCDASCSKTRSCPHPCFLQCHSGMCPPCEVQVTESCHCGRTLVKATCHQLAQVMQVRADGTSKDLLCCGKECERQIACGHLCSSMCHTGPCMPSSECQQTVSLRCKCRRRRVKLPCSQVQQLITAKRMPLEAMQTHILSGRLLDCRTECEEAAKVKRELRPAADGGIPRLSPTHIQHSGKEGAPTPVAGSAPEAAITSKTKKEGLTDSATRQLSKAERRRKSEQLEAKEAELAKRRRNVRLFKTGVTYVSTVAIVGALSFMFIMLLRTYGL